MGHVDMAETQICHGVGETASNRFSQENLSANQQGERLTNQDQSPSLIKGSDQRLGTHSITVSSTTLVIFLGFVVNEIILVKVSTGYPPVSYHYAVILNIKCVERII